MAQEPVAEVVVTGRGLDPAPGDRTGAVVTIDRDRIAASAAARLESVLADVAGLQQFRRSDSRSANPTSQGLSLRGIGGNASSRALLILDGVPQADPFGGWVAFPAYATDRLGSVRVTRGGGSGYHGPGALAGTIELESASAAQLTPLTARLAYGGRAAFEGQGSTALIESGGFATLSAAYARGEGFVPVIAENRGLADRAAPYEQASVAARGVIGVGRSTELQANVSAFTDRRDRGTDFTVNRSEGADASLRLVGRGTWKWSALGYIQTRAFASSFAGVDAARTVATRTLDQYNTPATGLGARIEASPPVGGDVSLRFGADVRAVEGRTQELYSFVAGQPTRRRATGGASRTIGAFADAALEVGTLTLTLGARLDRWRIADGTLAEYPLAGGAPTSDLRFADRSGNEASGRIGAAWAALPTLQLRAAVYRGWRLPTLNELYRPFRVGADATAANPLLAPERLAGYEAGARWRPAGGVTLAVTAFDNRLTDAVANVAAGSGPGSFPGVGFIAAGGVYRVRQNLDAIRARGIEFDAEAGRGPVFVRASWSHVVSRVEATGSAAALDRLAPAQTPRDQLSATLGWRRDVAAASVTLRHVAAQFEDDQNLRRLAAATTLDASAALPLMPTLVLEARAENLADARVEAGINGAGVVERATPRTLWIGLRYGGR
ncbi:TonB-dependent receptor [Sphingomonas sp.]|uniref:TonB-dependent receptor n=1 Tax=Sphingomonas sp. TaxID=28214 RepID=UPI002DD63521|nr:TonB-dependent receptor [Sphingomonas sp.]